MHTDNFSYDSRYEPPEYGKEAGKVSTHSQSTDIWRYNKTLNDFSQV